MLATTALPPYFPLSIRCRRNNIVKTSIRLCLRLYLFCVQDNTCYTQRAGAGQDQRRWVGAWAWTLMRFHKYHCARSELGNWKAIYMFFAIVQFSAFKRVKSFAKRNFESVTQSLRGWEGQSYLHIHLYRNCTGCLCTRQYLFRVGKHLSPVRHVYIVNPESYICKSSVPTLRSDIPFKQAVIKSWGLAEHHCLMKGRAMTQDLLFT